MEYVDMFNSEEKLPQTPYSCFVDPRISFSNDFVEPTKVLERKRYKEAPVSSSEFEFGVKDDAMIPADEIFFQGVLVPWKCGKGMTLREKLCADGEEEEEEGNEFERSVMVKVKSSSWWRERFGLKSKKDQQKRDAFAFCHGGGEVGLGSRKSQNCLAHILECDG